MKKFSMILTLIFTLTLLTITSYAFVDNETRWELCECGARADLAHVCNLEDLPDFDNDDDDNQTSYWDVILHSKAVTKKATFWQTHAGSDWTTINAPSGKYLPCFPQNKYIPSLKKVYYVPSWIKPNFPNTDYFQISLHSVNGEDNKITVEVSNYTYVNGAFYPKTLRISTYASSKLKNFSGRGWTDAYLRIKYPSPY